jgi:pyruvate dehydrogenase (quinone)
MVPEQLPNVIDRAIRIAASRRTVTALIIPSDLQELEYSAPSHAFKMVPSSLDLSWSAPVPTAQQLDRAAEILNAGSKVAILVGQGHVARPTRSPRLPT